MLVVLFVTLLTVDGLAFTLTAPFENAAHCRLAAAVFRTGANLAPGTRAVIDCIEMAAPPSQDGRTEGPARPPEQTPPQVTPPLPGKPTPGAGPADTEDNPRNRI